MADSINLDIGYFDHIKTVRLASMLGRGAEMLPIRLWCYCGIHPKDNGTLTDFSADDVEAVILKWWGKRGQAVEALVKVGFLDFDGTTYRAHGFNEKNGHIIAFHERAVKAAGARWGKLRGEKCLSIATSNATSIAKQCPTDRPTVLPTNLPTKQGLGLKRSERTFVEVDSGGYGGKNGTGNEVSHHQNQNHFLDRVVEFADDEGSRAFFQKAVKKLGEGLVEEAMGEVKMREADGSVNSRAPYFIALLENWMENRP